MKRYELLSGIALLVLCILFGWFLWVNDAERQTVELPRPARRVPASFVADGAAMSHPVGGAVICRFARDVPVNITGSMVTAGGAVYLRVRIAPACVGWVPAENVINYPAWRNSTERGKLIDN